MVISKLTREPSEPLFGKAMADSNCFFLCLKNKSDPQLQKRRVHQYITHSLMPI